MPKTRLKETQHLSDGGKRRSNLDRMELGGIAGAYAYACWFQGIPKVRGTKIDITVQ